MSLLDQSHSSIAYLFSSMISTAIRLIDCFEQSCILSRESEVVVIRPADCNVAPTTKHRKPLKLYPDEFPMSISTQMMPEFGVCPQIF